MIKVTNQSISPHPVLLPEHPKGGHKGEGTLYFYYAGQQLQQVGNNVTRKLLPKEPLINLSFRRRPESMSLKSLDPGIRRDDGKVINQVP
jgi:hypothetical protein